MSIIPESGKYETDVQTVAGYDVSIVVTPTGYYRIKAEGKGQPPGEFDQIFTGLKQARKALSAWAEVHKAEIAKKAMIKEVANRGKGNSE
jgi:hypothetical protein